MSPRRYMSAAGLTAVLLLSGCGAGQNAQTYQNKSVGDATNDNVGAIAVRNLAVLGPKQGTVYAQGSDARVIITLVNQGGDPDVLQSVTTPAAASVRVAGPTSELEVPALETADPSYALVLVDLTRELPTGTYIELTLTFQRNGSKTVLVPVQVAPGNVERAEGDYEVPETDSAGKPVVKPTASG